MCRLYSNAEEDDKLAMREAGIKAAEEVREESMVSADATEEVAVNVEDILQAGSPVQAPQPTVSHRGAVAANPHWGARRWPVRRR